MSKSNSSYKTLAVAVVLSAAALVHAGETPDFGVMDAEPNLAAWLDLAPLMSNSRVEKIRDGVDFIIDFNLILNRPKRFFGAETVVKRHGIVQIGYRIVTEDFIVRMGGEGFQRTGKFANLAELHRYLTDSIVVDLIDYSELDSLRRYRLKLELACISMSGLNLEPSPDSSTEDESALKYLFRHFLKLTGFGRDSFSGQTLLFSPAEVRQK
ncbi:MAG: hypothetical protein OEV49_11690 [candidate division Zixibacteria bacterium]|nr:hypothetical protein [candidate division Zixibacteria bacterium]MDH3938267.1 hypothetical protein [candidate division Zixibacteria bacterium]MDH4035404.1 hypothetical protein [candidate division Zixibacteria bacterium]